MENIMTNLLENYIVSEIDDQRYCRSNGHFTRHLREQNLTYQEYYEKYITGIIELCLFCGKLKKFYQKDHTYADTCGGPICVGKQISITKSKFTDEQWTNQKTAYNETMAEKTDEEIIAMYKKRRETNLQVNEDGLNGYNRQKNKSKETKAQRYGDPKYNNSEQISNSKQERTVEQNNITNDKRRKTMKEKYGVENNFLRPGVRQAVALKNRTQKEYILPSGTIAKVLGYEPRALDTLLEIYNEDMIQIGQFNINKPTDIGTVYTLPVFKYVDFKGRHRKYYPDIYIPSKNLIIEVKSQWWYNGYGRYKYKSRLENNMSKRQACLDAGYNFEFWIWNEKNKEFDIK